MRRFSLSLPRSISEALGLCEYGVPLYTASSSFSFTCVTVSQFRLFTITSGAFSFSGFTQCSVYRGRGQRSSVTFRPGSQRRLGALTIDVGKHDPAKVFDLQHLWKQFGIDIQQCICSFILLLWMHFFTILELQVLFFSTYLMFISYNLSCRLPVLPDANC